MIRKYNTAVMLPIILLTICSLGMITPKKVRGEAFTRAEKIPAVIIGDRLADVAYHLGYLPEGLVIRCSLWPLCKEIRNVALPLGCPSCISKAKKKKLPAFIEKHGIKKVYVEKSPAFCTYAPDVKLENIVENLKRKDLDIQYVDFSKGIPAAVTRTAILLGCKEKAAKIIDRYEKNLAKAKEKIPADGINKNVLIINGVYQETSGKSFLRVEAAGGYADRFLLEPIKCTNTAVKLNPEEKSISKGHFMVRKFDFLTIANPDVIVITGDSLGVQKAIEKAVLKHPELMTVPAIKNLAIYSLPTYVDAGVLEYPSILMKWVMALK